MTDLSLASLVISILAVGVAIWATLASHQQARHAREAVAEAKAQNRIALHNERLRIYKALLAFRGSVTARGVSTSDEELWRLWEHVIIAEFYFSPPLAKQLSGLMHLFNEFLASRALWKDQVLPPEERERNVRASYEILERVRKTAEDVDLEMRKELRLVEG